jgi:glycosyltransferase involved in cell wall biosynthesis
VKILVLSNLYPPDFIGGYEIACGQLAEALRDRGHDVLVATGTPRHPVAPAAGVRRVFRLVDEWNENSMGVEAVVRELRSAESRLISSDNVHALTTLLEEFAPDVVLASNVCGLGGLGLLACLQFLGVPWVWHLGDCVPRFLCSKYQVFDRHIDGIVAEFNRRIRGRFIVVTEQLRREIEADGIRLNGTVEIIPYWITGRRPAELVQAPTFPARDGTLRIMSAGRVTREKGIEVLIEAAARLRDAGFANFAIDIYGEADGFYFHNLVRRRDLEEWVRLMGVVPHRELVELYSQYDLFAFPTAAREPFGLVPLEAAARGRATVMSHRCGIAEWLVHGVHCLKVARSPEGFAAVFRAILEGSIALEPVARRAQAAAWRDFHLGAIVPRIERTLADAARQPRRATGTAAEAFRLARLAEQLTQVLIQESTRVA